MRVVPRVVVDYHRSVRHPSDLIAVIPPRHDIGVLFGVLAKPVVALPEIINNIPISLIIVLR